MITAKFSVQPIDRGWAVSIGPDVLVRSPTKDQAMLQADRRAAAIRQLGGQAIVVEEPPGAFESPVSRTCGNLSLQITLSTAPGASRSAKKGTG